MHGVKGRISRSSLISRYIGSLRMFSHSTTGGHILLCSSSKSSVSAYDCIAGSLISWHLGLSCHPLITHPTGVWLACKLLQQMNASGLSNRVMRSCYSVPIAAVSNRSSCSGQEGSGMASQILWQCLHEGYARVIDWCERHPKRSLRHRLGVLQHSHADQCTLHFQVFWRHKSFTLLHAFNAGESQSVCDR